MLMLASGDKKPTPNVVEAVKTTERALSAAPAAEEGMVTLKHKLVFEYAKGTKVGVVSEGEHHVVVADDTLVSSDSTDDATDGGGDVEDENDYNYKYKYTERDDNQKPKPPGADGAGDKQPGEALQYIDGSDYQDSGGLDDAGDAGEYFTNGNENLGVASTDPDLDELTIDRQTNIIWGVTVGGLFLLVLGGAYLYLHHGSKRVEIVDGGAFDFKQQLKELIVKGELDLHDNVNAASGTVGRHPDIATAGGTGSAQQDVKLADELSVDEIPRSRIQIGERIGGGNFGDVHIGMLKPQRRSFSKERNANGSKPRRGRRSTNVTFDVAVKQVKNDGTMSKGEYLVAQEELLKEVSLDGTNAHSIFYIKPHLNSTNCNELLAMISNHQVRHFINHFCVVSLVHVYVCHDFNLSCYC